MGVTAGDYDRDGLLDIFKTNFADDTHTLYRNLGANTRRRYHRFGIGGEHQVSWMGHSIPGRRQRRVEGPDRCQRSRLSGSRYRPYSGKVQNKDGSFIGNRGDGQFFDLSRRVVQESPTSIPPRSAVGDLDNDGQLEIVIVNMNEPPSLLKNLGPRTGNSLIVRLLTASGSDAIGARVTLASAAENRSMRSAAAVLSSRKATFGCTSVLPRRPKPTCRCGGLSARAKVFPR